MELLLVIFVEKYFIVLFTKPVAKKKKHFKKQFLDIVDFFSNRFVFY